MSLTKNEIKFIKSLQLKKFRDQHQQFVIEGEKVVNELFTQDKFSVKKVYYTEEFDVNLIPSNLESKLISNKDLDRITGFKKANKILAIANFNTISDIDFDENNLILILDNVKDPGNLGTIIRTADWFGITQIIVSENTVELYNPKVIQSSMGAIYRMNFHIKSLTNVITEFKNNDYTIYGAVMNGKNIYKTDIKAKSVLVMGSESHGISNEILNLTSDKITIPNFGKSESLNVAMASGILLSEYKKSEF